MKKQSMQYRLRLHRLVLSDWRDEMDLIDMIYGLSTAKE